MSVVRVDRIAPRTLSCNGICLTARDVGIEQSGIAYPHPECPAHGGVCGDCEGSLEDPDTDVVRDSEGAYFHRPCWDRMISEEEQ